MCAERGKVLAVTSKQGREEAASTQANWERTGSNSEHHGCIGRSCRLPQEGQAWHWFSLAELADTCRGWNLTSAFHQE